jgi:hypothetical protein
MHAATATNSSVTNSASGGGGGGGSGSGGSLLQSTNIEVATRNNSSSSSTSYFSNDEAATARDLSHGVAAAPVQTNPSSSIATASSSNEATISNDEATLYQRIKKRPISGVLNSDADAELTWYENFQTLLSFIQINFELKWW